MSPKARRSRSANPCSGRLRGHTTLTLMFPGARGNIVGRAFARHFARVAGVLPLEAARRVAGGASVASDHVRPAWAQNKEVMPRMRQVLRGP